jgi:hypothetical protein
MPVTNAEIFSKLMDVSDVVSRIEPTVNDLKKAVITGNGKPGLLERVNCIEIARASESDQKKEVKENKKTWDGRMWALSVSVFLLFAGQIVILIFK